MIKAESFMAGFPGKLRSRSAIAILSAVISLTGMPASSHADETAYVWANDKKGQDYAPDARFSHNPAGGPIYITRQAEGKYTVQFVGLGGDGMPGGNAQVTAMEGDATTCKAATWTSSGADFTINVLCFDLHGTPADATYSALVTWAKAE